MRFEDAEIAERFTMSVDVPLPPSGIDVLDRPVSPAEKAVFVRGMFDEIAPAYDFLNNTLSAGIHHRWRRLATRCAALGPGDSVLDLCTGTGDWVSSLRAAVGGSGRIVALDFSRGMLNRGRRRFGKYKTACIRGDAVELPLRSDVFDAVTVAFGLRNVGDLPQSLREICRVTKPGGRLVCLEFAQPHRSAFRIFYQWYSAHIMPRLGGAVSGRADAYAYLPASVSRFPTRAELAARMAECGFSQVRWIDMTFGLVAVHVAVKPAQNGDAG
jgi:demethylmenaquinone methyltransferase/2-methoxy-6-polyprenyl-1,4-benzoquinol methylase